MKTRLVSGFSLFILLSIVLLFQIGCPGVQYPNCKTDSQCQSNSGIDAKSGVCVFGKCQECANDADCADDKLCRDNLCVQMCAGDIDCDASSHCNAGVCDPNCEDSSDCDDGEICVSARCAVQTSCSQSSDCDSGFACESSLCVQSMTADNTDCANSGTVFFAFDKNELNQESVSVLDHIASCVRGSKNVKLLVAGHTDDRGTTEYNMSLGERRARAAADYLTNLGVNSVQLRIVSYGEENPLDLAANETAWAKNRRSEITVE